MFYLTTHSTHFIYGYMASDIWLRTILIVRHLGYSLRLTARVLSYAPSHRQDSTYHSLCYTSRGALAGTRNSSIGSRHEGSIRRPIAPWANTLTTELHLAPCLSGACLNTRERFDLQREIVLRSFSWKYVVSTASRQMLYRWGLIRWPLLRSISRSCICISGPFCSSGVRIAVGFFCNIKF